FLIGLLTTDWHHGRSSFMEYPVVLVVLGLDVLLFGLHVVVFAKRYTQDWFARVERIRKGKPRWIGRLVLACWEWHPTTNSPTAHCAFMVIVGALFTLLSLWFLFTGLTRL